MHFESTCQGSKRAISTPPNGISFGIRFCLGYWKCCFSRWGKGQSRKPDSDSVIMLRRVTDTYRKWTPLMYQRSAKNLVLPSLTVEQWLSRTPCRRSWKNGRCRQQGNNLPKDVGKGLTPREVFLSIQAQAKLTPYNYFLRLQQVLRLNIFVVF